MTNEFLAWVQSRLFCCWVFRANDDIVCDCGYMDCIQDLGQSNTAMIWFNIYSCSGGLHIVNSTNFTFNMIKSNCDGQPGNNFIDKTSEIIQNFR